MYMRGSLVLCAYKLILCSLRSSFWSISLLKRREKELQKHSVGPNYCKIEKKKGIIARCTTKTVMI